MSYKKLLIIEDAEPLVHSYISYLNGDKYEIEFALNGTDGLEKFDKINPDALLLDLNLPDIQGIDILKKIRKTNDRCAIIVITGQASVNTAVEVMQLGGDDFVSKPVSPERLKVSLDNALEKRRLEQIANTYESITRTSFCDFVGKSRQMQAIYNIIENAAHSNASVFITGESGTGKELAARAVHNLSSRRNMAYEALNCAAIPHNLLESEIFGHVKGAFTGATSNREGAARRAHKGTLFLDELGEMPMELQSKMLRFIQTGTFMPVGGSKQEQVDIRFVCATNIKPLEAVKNKTLREDLYYRLNVIPVNLPPLRERDNDIILLAEYFLEKITYEEKKEFTSFAKDAKEVMMKYKWSGNVRELENVIRSAIVLNQGSTIDADMLPNLKVAMRTPQTEIFSEISDNIHKFPNLPSNPNEIIELLEVEKEYIESSINICNGNITLAAKKLGINPSTIHRKMKSWENK